jgi:hypothetical protein
LRLLLSGLVERNVDGDAGGVHRSDLLGEVVPDVPVRLVVRDL